MNLTALLIVLKKRALKLHIEPFLIKGFILLQCFLFKRAAPTVSHLPLRLSFENLRRSDVGLCISLRLGAKSLLHDLVGLELKLLGLLGFGFLWSSFLLVG